MTEKPNNTIAILVAVIALLIIIGSLFVLSQSLSKKPVNEISEKKSVESSSSTLSSKNQASSSKSTFSSQNNNSSQNNSARFSSISRNSSVSNSSSSSNSNNSQKSLNSGELVVKYIGGERPWEIVQCQSSAPVIYCKTGFKFNYSTTGSEEIGTNYKFSGGEFSDNETGFSLSNYLITKIS